VFEADGVLVRLWRLLPSAGLLSRDFSNCLTLSFIKPFRPLEDELSAGTDFAELRTFVRGPAGPETERFVERAGEFVAEDDEGSLEAPPVALARRGLVGAAIKPSSVWMTMSG
jgi:hypothetical protein